MAARKPLPARTRGGRFRGRAAAIVHAQELCNLLRMGEPADTNAAIWKSAEAVQAWTAEAERQERSRRHHRRFMALLLPFGEQDEFTFLDLGAGTGAASRA